ncbi:MAG: hypothetical protein Q8N35_15365 [Methylococcaceae bacterium]|nr:hypothetical protein [Methylococcaceae bacterium]MDP2392054.1 hypothetical protein [Methylococcaceae bacterium]MDP3020958.1 hypothetical protein [Methylococcaceae bacterium]MDP3391171.1 hypothetical protein [Methylococcaceae bacterium]MDP3931714.1 hypothetical protein [Methylococcaceae bacterium]
MASISTADLLAAWERGGSQSMTRRVLTLLATVYPELSDVQLLSLPIGQRDGLALKLRELLFGPQLSIVAKCPFCHEQLEVGLDVADICVEQNTLQHQPFALSIEGFELQFRLPDSQDLLHIEAVDSLDTARNVFFERCLLSATYEGQACPVAALPEEVLNKIEATMSAADPQADVELDLCCPDCLHSWLAPFDIASFLWTEINAWAQRVLNEVHLLAQAYSWREADILAMSAARRRYYLERVLQ